MIEQYTNSVTKNNVALYLVDTDEGHAFVVVVDDCDNMEYQETKYRATDFRSAIKHYDEVKEKFKHIQP